MEYNQQYQCLRDFALKATKTPSGAINWDLSGKSQLL
jgi:hypothetical protein